MKIAGIDADTKTITVFIVERNRPSYEGTSSMRLEAKGRKSEDRFLTLVQQMRESLPPLFGPKLGTESNYVYVERPFVGPNRKAAIDMGMVIGALRGELARLAIPHSLVDPARWKTHMLGTSRVSKEEIKAWAIVRFGLGDKLAQDYYDAACIAAYGMQVLGDGQSKSSRR